MFIINALLNKEYCAIILDRIRITDENNNKILVTNQMILLTPLLNTLLINLKTKTTNLNYYQSSEKWKKTYKPLNNINDIN